ncbi:MAG TPA: sigma-54 dependent transcriptional regulator [Bdellovibrionales bacterium]|nr:sigma-54 dependent transcriptional regulator [Bdellovibrionales bacterium]
MLKVLVVDDDAGLRLTVATTLKNTGRFEVEEAFDGQNAIERVKAGQFDVVILDVDMPRLNGLQALKLIKEHDPRIIVLVLTAFANINDAVEAVKHGAYNYISKPVKSEELVGLVDKALEAYAMISSVAASSPILIESGRKFIGNTAEMQKVFNIINKLSQVDTAVLIRGESGTGKELVARAIHYNSARKDQKFVAINCSAIPENLFESELFGHEKGSFTGADYRKVGKFQFAEGGTLFLDEIGDMPVLMQAKLLRVLQEKKFTPVGSLRELDSNVRVIAATNKPLEKMIEEGTFREDLFYRLNVIPIFLPPLRDRKQDLDYLCQNFITKFNQLHAKKMIGISPEAMSCLKKYSWPGNIRELENVIEHSFVLEESNRLTLKSLPEKILKEVNLSEVDRETNAAVNLATGTTAAGTETPVTGPAEMPREQLDFNKQKENFEKEFIIMALKTFKGRINQTALHANIPKKTLLRKIEKYGINPRDYIEPKP